MLPPERPAANTFGNAETNMHTPKHCRVHGYLIFISESPIDARAIVLIAKAEMLLCSHMMRQQP